MNSFCFNIEKFIYTQKDSELDLSFIPANTRRRLNLFDKHVLYLINNCLTPDVENIILSSQYGEFDRLQKLIEQYKDMNEVSPMAFSSSVHNYALGQFSLLKQITIPTVSIAGGVNSFEAGLITSLSVSKKNVIYCYADNKDNDIVGVAFKIKNNEQGYIINKTNSSNITTFENIVDFFNKKKDKIDLTNYSIKRG